MLVEMFTLNSQQHQFIPPYTSKMASMLCPVLAEVSKNLAAPIRWA